MSLALLGLETGDGLCRNDWIGSGNIAKYLWKLYGHENRSNVGSIGMFLFVPIETAAKAP